MASPLSRFDFDRPTSEDPDVGSLVGSYFAAPTSISLSIQA
ncbi:MAG: hypothetical protein JWQ42_1988 [Edaphobacter sp.]|nr:hypothetical protein [Edaphobacter sp.]